MAEINVLEDFTQTVYADDNTPNATGDCVEKSLQEVKKASKILFHLFSLQYSIHEKFRGVE